MSYPWTKSEFDAFARVDFQILIEKVFAELNPGEAYYDNWHIALLAEQFAAVRAGRTRRLVVNIPPRALKSIIGSVAFVAWLLGHNPGAKIICASYGESLSLSLARMCLKVMQSDWYRRLFPGTRLVSDRPAAEFFNTSAGGYRIATSVGAAITGFGADYIIIDDPSKPEDALSETIRRSVNAWFAQSALTRLNDKRFGRVVIIGQRLHEDDLSGFVLAQGGWSHVCLPAIAEVDEVYAIQTPFGILNHHRRAGDALHPAREPVDVLENLQAQMGSDFYSAQFQQSPTPPGGSVVKIDWFPRFDLENPPKFDQVIASWDTASKLKDTNGFSVCTIWGVVGKKAYLLHVFRQRLEIPELLRKVIEQANSHHASLVLVEDASSGSALIQLLREVLPIVRGCTPVGDKEMRMRLRTPLIENGMVYLPERAPWLQVYLHELSMFPKGRFSDQVDSTSQFLDWLQANQGGTFAEHLGRLLAKDRGMIDPVAEPRPVRAVCRIAGDIVHKANSGRQVRPEPDGTFLVTEREAAGLQFDPDWTVISRGEKG